MKSQKRIAAIHDISGIGKCSLTAAVPIISASGIETAVMPTAVLSTHTGNIDGFTYRDLTTDMPLISEHWRSLGIELDGIYSGFLGSTEQVDIVSDFIDKFKTDKTVVLVDPAMADGGMMYKTFKPGFADEMKKLCRKADIIVPNLTETAFLLDLSYEELKNSKSNIENALLKFGEYGCRTVVLTGVSFDEKSIGCAVCDNGSTKYYFSEKYPGTYYGTGDIFASALLGAFMNGIDIFSSAEIALNFTAGAIKRTYEAGTDTRLGVNFECGLYDYTKAIMKNKIFGTEKLI